MARLKNSLKKTFFGGEKNFISSQKLKIPSVWGITNLETLTILLPVFD